MLVAPLLLVELTIVQFFVHVDVILPTPPPEELVSAVPLATLALAFRFIKAILGATSNSSVIGSSLLGMPPSRSAQYAIGFCKISKQATQISFFMKVSAQVSKHGHFVLDSASLSVGVNTLIKCKKPNEKIKGLFTHITAAYLMSIDPV